MPPSPHILLLESDAVAPGLAALVLRGRWPAVRVSEVRGAIALAEHLADGGFDAAIIDLGLEWADGVEVLRLLRRRYPRVPVAVRSAVATLGDAALREGAVCAVGRTDAGWLELVRALDPALAGHAHRPPPGRPAEGTQPAQRPGNPTCMEPTPTPAAAPDPTARWLDHARTARQAGDADAEQRALAKALELDPACQAAVDRLLELHADDDRAAIGVLERHVAALTEPATLRSRWKQLIALHIERRNDPEGAIHAWTEWRRRDPHHAELAGILRDVFRRSHRWLQYAGLLRELIHEALEPGRRLPLLVELAEIEADRLGRRRDAIDTLEKAQRLAPLDTDVAQRLQALRVAEADGLPLAEKAPSAVNLRATQPLRPGMLLALVKQRSPEPTPHALPTLDALPPRQAQPPHDALPPHDARPTPTAALARMAAVLGHDLQEPLRSVANYLNVLESRHTHALDPDALALLDKARRATGRMQDRVASVVAAVRPELPPASLAEPVDADAVLAQTLDDLHAAIERAGGQVTCDPLPPVRLAAGELGQLLQNLVSNALKFRGKPAPRVHVAGSRGPEGVVLSVRDNGIGVQPADRARIFELFERGSQAGDFPGTGIGLALCSRIVRRAGGRIWVDSEPGQGATFRVLVPEPEVADAAAVR